MLLVLLLKGTAPFQDVDEAVASFTAEAEVFFDTVFTDEQRAAITREVFTENYVTVALEKATAEKLEKDENCDVACVLAALAPCAAGAGPVHTIQFIDHFAPIH